MRPSSLLACALVCGLIACGAGSKSAPGQESGASNQCDRPKVASGELKFKSAGWKTNFCKHSIPYEEFRSGGQPRDGIPPIDAPKFVTPSDADRWIRDVEPVISLEINGVARAYPLQVLIWHEIVNDEIGGTPIAVTFYPCATQLSSSSDQPSMAASSALEPQAICERATWSCGTARPSRGGSSLKAQPL